jgi:hypothetical protein
MEEELWFYSFIGVWQVGTSITSHNPTGVKLQSYQPEEAEEFKASREATHLRKKS